MDIRNELMEAIDLSFTKEHLTTGYLPYILRLFSIDKLPVADLRIQHLLSKKNRNKEELVTLVAAVFSAEELFREFFSMIPEEVRQLFEILMWEDGFLHEDVIKFDYGIEPTIHDKGAGWRSDSELKKEFHLLSAKKEYNWTAGYQYFLGIPQPLRKEIIDYFEKPKEYYLQPVMEIPGELQQFNAEKTIFQELPRLLVYANQDNIKLTTSGMPVASGYAKMRKALSLREYYEELPKPYDTIRTSLIATLLAESAKTVVSQDGLQSLEQLFAYFTNSFYPLHLLHHLKGLSYINDYDKYKTGKAYIDILREFPEEGSWVSMDNIYKFSSYRSISLKPAADYPLSRYAYYPVKTDGYTRKIEVNVYSYNKLIKKPVLQAGFSLFAAFGLVEAAYEEPAGEEEGEEDNPFYHKLSYVRLTSLGEYLSGRTKIYNPPQTEDKAEIQLLGDSLNILSDKPSQTVDVLLESFTVKVGSSRYKTDFATFMKGVRNADDLEAKISLFRQTVSSDLPPNWQAFFNTLKLKCDPLQTLEPHVAYQLSREDQEMISLVAKDPVLKQLVIKAEGLIILVMKKDLTKFKNRLKEFGYLPE